MRKCFILIFIFTASLLINSHFTTANIIDINAEAVIAFDRESSSILYSKNIHKKIFPASTTKVLTAILAIENLNLDSNITVSKEAISVPYLSSTIYLKENEILTVRELLYGLLLKSGNDAANVLAEAVSGSVSNFVLLMNSRLKELGCDNTNFVNAHGFHNINHYSTAYDMALIMSYASKNTVFNEISKLSEYTIKPTNKTNFSRKLKNTNAVLTHDLIGKTGYTGEAKNTFLFFSNLNNTVYGIFKSTSRNNMFKDSLSLTKYIFENFDEKKIISKDMITVPYLDKNINMQYLYRLDNDIYSLADKNEYFINYTIPDDNLTTEVIRLNIDVGNKNWKFNNSYDLSLYEKKFLLLGNNIKKTNSTYLYLILIVIILFVLLKLRLYFQKRINKK